MAYEDLAELLLKAMHSVTSERSATYVAGPLATGRRYYEALAAGQTVDAEALRSQNGAEIRRMVDQLRSRTVITIDPGLLRVSTWSGSEHGDFFLRVIESLCARVAFVDGWHFSSGATKEFVFAQELGIPCVDGDLAPLNVRRGLELVELAIAEVAALGCPIDVLERRRVALQRLG